MNCPSSQLDQRLFYSWHSNISLVSLYCYSSAFVFYGLSIHMVIELTMICSIKANAAWPLTKAQAKIHWSVCQKHGKFFVLNLKVLKSSSLFIFFKVNFIFTWHQEVCVVVADMQKRFCKRKCSLMLELGRFVKLTYFFGDMLFGYQLMATSQILHFFLTCNSYEHRYYLQVGWVATNNKKRLPKIPLIMQPVSCSCKWKFFRRSCELYICGMYPRLRKYLQLCLATIKRFCKRLPMKESGGEL